MITFTNAAFLTAGIILGFTIGWLMAIRQCARRVPGQISGSRSARASASKTNKKKRAARAENKKKILSYLAEHGSVKNDDLEKLLGVSDATVTRYMDQLEKEGKVAQRSATGRGVSYVLK